MSDERPEKIVMRFYNDGSVGETMFFRKKEPEENTMTKLSQLGSINEAVDVLCNDCGVRDRISFMELDTATVEAAVGEVWARELVSISEVSWVKVTGLPLDIADIDIVTLQSIEKFAADNDAPSPLADYPSLQRLYRERPDPDLDLDATDA